MMVQSKIVARNTSGRPPAPGRRQAHAPTNHGVSPWLRELGGNAMFYVSIQSFDDKDRPPAVSRGGACLRPGGWDVAWGCGWRLRPPNTDGIFLQYLRISSNKLNLSPLQPQFLRHVSQQLIHFCHR